MEAACTNEGGPMSQWRRLCIYLFMYQASSTVSSVISSSESVDLSKLSFFSPLCIYLFMYQASSTVSSVISSSESVDLSKLELLFSTILAR
jgi:hypothetical protein